MIFYLISCRILYCSLSLRHQEALIGVILTSDLFLYLCDRGYSTVIITIFIIRTIQATITHVGGDAPQSPPTNQSPTVVSSLTDKRVKERDTV